MRCTEEEGCEKGTGTAASSIKSHDEAVTTVAARKLPRSIDTQRMDRSGVMTLVPKPNSRR
jgi:hypothetical protein